MDVLEGLNEFGCEVDVFDPWADPDEVRHEYGVKSIRSCDELFNNFYDAVVLAVSHREFEKIDLNKYKKSNAVVYDIKGILPVNIIDGRL